MKSWLIKSIILISLFFTDLYCHAQTTQFNFELYTTANGLTDNKTGALLQDSRGFLWIGGSNGLNRFDGKTFKQYNSFGKNGLTDLVINCLAEDEDGNIWIGTQYGLNKLNPFTETITHYYDGDGPGTITSNYCGSLYFDKNKQLWFGFEKGIALYDKKTNSFKNFPVSLYGLDIKINKFIKCMLEDSRHRFWLGTSFGVKLFNPENKTYQSFHFKETDGRPNIENIIISLAEDNDGSIWAGTWGGSLLKYNPAKEIFEIPFIENLPNKNLYIPGFITVKQGKKNSLLFPANNRFYFLTQVNNKYVAEPVEFLNQAKPDDNYSHLLRDAEGNIWISGNGLYKIKTEPEALQRIFNDGGGSRWNAQIIPDIKQPETDFYLITADGWQQYNLVTGKTRLPPPLKTKNNFLEDVNDWCSDDTGYWIASRSGFGYYDIYNNQATDLTSLAKEKTGQTFAGFIEKDAAGKIWVTMWRSGILVYNPITKKADAPFTDSTKPVTLFGKTASDMKYHRDGYIYFCDEVNLHRINASDYSYKIIHPPAYEEKISAGKTGTRKILITNSNKVFVSSERRIYELRNDSLVTIYPVTGLSPYAIEKFKEDASGNIWVSTDKGIFKTDSTFKKWRNVLPGNDWENEFYSEINTTSNGRALFNGDNEIVVLTDSLLSRGDAPPVVIINRIKYGEKQNYFVSLHPVSIRSAYKDAIEIELSAIDFTNENKIMYQLDGWDNTWKELIGTSVIRYEQLPPGDYTFKTKTINIEETESKETILNFTVIPPFYRTWWFMLLSVLAIAAILYAIYHYRLQKAIEMEKLRTRIATDLHDDIGATLSSISMYSQAVKNQLKEKNPQLENVLDKMGENSRDMVTSMSDIVWAINPDNDDGEKLIRRMENYATDICAVKNIALHFNADEKINATVLPLEHRKNIYLIFKEAMNNAVKYSDAQNIWVQLGLQNKNLSLIIKDDGSGFDKATVKKGNGLKNGQIRAGEIKGTLTVDSVEGKGTTVSLVCTV